MEYVIKGNTAIIRLDKGDEIYSSVLEFAKKENVKCGVVSGIGATDEMEVGVYDLYKEAYKRHYYFGNREILSLTGNISVMNGEYVHLHITTQGEESGAVGGHLFKAVVSMTAEIFVTLVDYELKREYNDEVKINTLKF
ncbi:MAG: DNA-binding protein [Clostridia bacterium]|nr:DNA-binding protein [Clostridia bacterium]